MYRLKAVFAVLLSLVLIAGLALLPGVIANISDFLSNGKPEIASMNTVELTVYSDQADEPGYIMRKLALEQRMTTIPIKPEQAKMTEGEVITAAVDGMAPYIEAKMFEWFEYHFFKAEPYLGIDSENKDNNTIFWGVTFATKEEPYHHLFLHIDDETGKIIFINYETYGEDKYRYYYPEEQRLMMEGFVDSFLRPLSLTLGQLGEYAGLLAASVTEQELTDDVTCSRHTFEDAQYGVINLEFYITPVGFHVTYPGS